MYPVITTAISLLMLNSCNHGHMRATIRARGGMLLQIRNKRESRVMMADQRWDEVATWRGDFHDDEDLERWGDVMYTSFSGMDNREPMLVDVGVDVTVQVCERATFSAIACNCDAVTLLLHSYSARRGQGDSVHGKRGCCQRIDDT